MSTEGPICLPAQEMVEQFRRGTGSLAFACIKNRVSFADELGRRVDEPREINQGGAPLCGPAAFMYCIAKDRRAEYARYVLDLAEKGTGKLGNNLTVTPSMICRNASLDGKIDPVDWVALASLRDSANSFWRMSDPRSLISDTAGITMGGAMVDWFRATGWFPGGVGKAVKYNWSRPVDDLHHIDQHRQPKPSHRRPEPLVNLCGIDPRVSGGGHVCLLIRDAILDDPTPISERNRIKASGKSKKWRGFPNHWVVLEGHIGLPPSATPDHMLNFKVWSWGGMKTIKMPVRQFLPYYYGYVSALY